MHVCPEFVSVHQCPQTSEEGLGAPRSEVTDGFHVDIEPESSARAVNVLNHQTTSPAPCFGNFEIGSLNSFPCTGDTESVSWSSYPVVLEYSLLICSMTCPPKTHIPKDICVFHFLTHAFNPSTYEV